MRRRDLYQSWTRGFSLSSVHSHFCDLCLNILPRASRGLENFVPMPQIAECPDVGNDERHAKLVFRADVGEVDAAIFQREAAAASVVSGLHDLVLQRLIGEVVA